MQVFFPNFLPHLTICVQSISQINFGYPKTGFLSARHISGKTLDTAFEALCYQIFICAKVVRGQKRAKDDSLAFVKNEPQISLQPSTMNFKCKAQWHQADANLIYIKRFFLGSSLREFIFKKFHLLIDFNFGKLILTNYSRIRFWITVSYLSPSLLVLE